MKKILEASITVYNEYIYTKANGTNGSESVGKIRHLRSLTMHTLHQ